MADAEVLLDRSEVKAKNGVLDGRQLSFREMASLLFGVGFRDVWILFLMIATLLGEAAGFTKAIGSRNPDGTYDFGWCQLNSAHASGLGMTEEEFKQHAFDPVWAVHFARSLYLGALHQGHGAEGSIGRVWYAYSNRAKFFKAAGLGVGNMLAARAFNPGKQTYKYV